MLREVKAREALKEYTQGKTVLVILPEETEIGTRVITQLEYLIDSITDGLRFLAEKEEVEFDDIDVGGGTQQAGTEGETDVPLRKARGRKKAAGKEV